MPESYHNHDWRSCFQFEYKNNTYQSKLHLIYQNISHFKYKHVIVFEINIYHKKMTRQSNYTNLQTFQQFFKIAKNFIAKFNAKIRRSFSSSLK